jgi:glycosyltransferase involved in cell wall biosynthesis
MTVAEPEQSSPTVSVVLRTYDHAPFIAQAIESVLIQDTPFRFELVIGEDCSTDGTREIVTRYAERHPEVVRAVLPERNVGHGEIFKRALEATRGELIAYLDGDDYWTSPAKLRRQVDFLEANSDCASCFHDVSLVYGERGIPSGAVSPGLSEERYLLEDIVWDCFIPAPAVMFRRSVAERLPDWAFDVVWIDWLLHICAATLGPLGYIPATLGAYRVHRGGMFSALDRISQIEEDFPFYERLALDLPEQRERIERCVAYRHSQIAIERLGVPFDACVVLIDPRRETRPYFNGRHSRTLPRLDTRPVTELDAIRGAAATLSTANRDYDSPTQAKDGKGYCYVVVPAAAAEWMEEHRQLAEYLEEQGSTAWFDDWSTVYELAPIGAERTDGRPRSPLRVEVSMRQPQAEELAGGFLEAPTSGALLPAHAIGFCGWVLGRESRAVAIEFEAGSRLLWRAPVNIDRSDVRDAFPEHGVATVGFQTTLNALDLDGEASVEVLAVLEDGSRVPLAEVACGSPAAGEGPAAAGT